MKLISHSTLWASLVAVVVAAGGIDACLGQLTPADGSGSSVSAELRGGVSGLVQTTVSDPDWVLVTSDAILRSSLCNPSWYDRLYNPCYNYNRYWKLAPGASGASAFPMASLGTGTFDGLYVKEGIRFQLYQGSTDANPFGPRMTGPKYVSIDVWAANAPNGFEPGTFLVTGGPGELSNYSISLGSDLEIVDPNPQLLSGGALVGDLQRLAEGGRMVEGLAADGVTIVLLRLGVSGAGQVTFTLRDDTGGSSGVGALRTLGGNENTTTVVAPVQSVGAGSDMAFAVWTAPNDFVRDAQDHARTDRPVTVEAVFTPSGGSADSPVAKEVKLVRPPVMLIHGLWSDKGTWGWSLLGDARFKVYTQDYAPTHASPFLSNVGQPRAGVASAIRLLRDQKIAVTQADVFGHSMGGLLSRLYIAGARGDYLREDNLLRGDIHKLITVDTPHHGSPLANILVGADNDPTLLGSILNAAGKCVNCGAVRDLRPDSPVVSSLPAAQIPAHAIVGVGGSDLVQAGSLFLLPPAWRIVPIALRFFNILPDDLFPEIQHDLIVGRISQEGGLGTGSSRTSVVGFQLGVSTGIHTSVTSEDVVGNWAIGLLNAPVGDASVFAPGFPAGGARNDGGLAPPAPALSMAQGGGIVVTSPAPGTAVIAGGQVAVVVEATGDYVPTSVLIFTETDAEIVEGAPFVTTMDVPPDSIGQVVVWAYGIDAQDAVAVAEPVALSVTVPATLTGISLQPDTLYLYSFSPIRGVTAMGHYDDGVDRVLAPSMFGTVYQSANANVASVDPDGVVTGHVVGRVKVTATAAGQSGTATIRVISAKGDFDSDGGISLVDFGVLQTCFSGPKEGAGYSAPNLACRDAFDWDYDTDVDLDDFGGFRGAFTGPAPDCNGNRRPDVADIAEGPDEDCNLNAIPDSCELAQGGDCNQNGRIDACELAEGSVPDCNGNGLPDSCDIAGGASADCNFNNVPDSCDIASGVSRDCNANGVPDDCDISTAGSPDCNGNQVPDECDLAAGTSPDCNANARPDECDINYYGSSFDCNTNTVPDECDVAAGTSPDCNANARPDECDINYYGSSFDCNANAVPDECDVAAGTSPDCNTNLLPDECDIAYYATSVDCDANAVPDECDLSSGAGADCNLNGALDVCDLTDLTSLDCNGNGVPDECDIASGASSDCNGNAQPDECDLAMGGGSPDCNANAVPDECDIAGGASGDCDFDGVPDECQIASGASPDCNANAVPDDCDISAGTAPDCNGNAIPDSCDLAGGAPDCNLNAIPDECDILEATSEDCNFNMTPDECELAAGTAQDCNANGAIDECDINNGASLDCDFDGVPDDCQIAGGTSEDCNANAIPDECDIFGGTSMDCDLDGAPDECQIAAGTAQDCNANGVLDSCDIAGATSEDCNANAIPDECEGLPDCNFNLVPDECDLSIGFSLDCNGNAIPDECDISEGTSMDCDFDGAPDECQLASGAEQDCNLNGMLDTCDIYYNATSEDCNGNGVPDECDIGEGTSDDLNGNGIPDECE